MTDIVSVHQLVSEAIILSDAPKDEDDAEDND
jgi:hypothetical protein